MLEGAEHPHDIADHIEEVLHEIAEKKKKKDKAPMELLLHTLTEVVREHLEWGNNNHETVDDTSEDKKEIEKILSRKGTVDLR